ncbi:unnamed protein product, partial [Heterobilharzia americana]
NQPLDLNELVDGFLQVIKDKTIFCLHQSFFDTVCTFISETYQCMIVLDDDRRNGRFLVKFNCLRSDILVLYRTKQFNNSVIGSMLCLLIHQFSDSPSLPITLISTAVVEFFKR